jgi:prepilin-type N-terminal cleavage/methylation domain-containing protein
LNDQNTHIPAHTSRTCPAFTLVELLVVIGIIGVLLAVLLPSLSRAREAAKTIKCAANLRSIGQGMAVYVVDYKGYLPASNTWRNLQILPDTQLPSTPVYGTIHWSSYLYGGKAVNDGTNNVYRSPGGWEMLQCPSLDQGGLPPANTFPGNSTLGNEAGADPATGQPVIDAQAPRLAYTVNEALCPRGFFVAGATVAGSMIERPYQFVRESSVRNSSGVILAAELWGIQPMWKSIRWSAPGRVRT